jgi:hypothetical protein
MNTQEVSDPKSWAERTFGRVQLHDMRRTRRAVQAATQHGGEPLGVLRHANMHSWKETKALYRLRRSSQMSPWLMRGFVIEQLYEDAKRNAAWTTSRGGARTACTSIWLWSCWLTVSWRCNACSCLCLPERLFPSVTRSSLPHYSGSLSPIRSSLSVLEETNEVVLDAQC